MMDDTDLTDPHGEAEALRRENAALASWACPFRDGSGLTHDEWGQAVCMKADDAEDLRKENADLRRTIQNLRQIERNVQAERERQFQRAEAAEAALAAAPVAEAQPVAWRVYGMMRQGFPSHVKATGRGSEPTEYLYPADRGIDAAECARLMRGEVQPLYAHPPAQPTIGGAELDALVAQAMTPHTVAAHQVAAALHRQTVDPLQSYVTIEQCLEYGQRIRDAALRAQPDWKAMAERLGDAMKPCLNFIENTESEFGIALECGNKARAALSDLAKMKGE